MSYKNYYDQNRIQSDEKDVIIAQLKADLYEIRQNERDFNELQLHFKSLNHKVSLLLEEKNRNEKDVKIKKETIYKNILNLNQELDHKKSDFSEQNIRVQEMKANNSELREILNQKNSELNAVKKEMLFTLEKSKIISQKRIDTSNKNKSIKEEQNNFLNELNNLKYKFEQIVKQNKEYIKNLNDLESERNDLEINQSEIIKINDKKNQEYKKKIMDLDKLDENLEGIQKEIESLEEDFFQIQNSIDNIKFENEALKNKNLEESNKEKEILNWKETLKEKLKIQNDYLNEIEKDLNNLKNNNFQLKKDNEKFISNFEENQVVLNEIKNLKSNLTEVLINYGENNEKAKNFLVRKDIIKKNLNNSEERVSQSYNKISFLFEN